MQYMLEYSYGFKSCEYELFDYFDDLFNRLEYLKKFYKDDKCFFYSFYIVVK